MSIPDAIAPSSQVGGVLRVDVVTIPRFSVPTNPDDPDYESCRVETRDPFVNVGVREPASPIPHPPYRRSRGVTHGRLPSYRLHKASRFAIVADESVREEECLTTGQCKIRL